MNDEPRVWVCRRPRKDGKVGYRLRWVDPLRHKWRSKAVGTDSKRAKREAVLLEKALADGTHQDLRSITWADFVQEHVRLIPGKVHRAAAKRLLDDFGQQFGLSPKLLTFAMVETYVAGLRKKKLAQATINKNLRYLRAAFNAAVKRGYAVKSPMAGWRWERVEQKALRIASEDDEAALLSAAGDLYGSRYEAFIIVALGTGGRRSELLGLTWDRVDLDAVTVHFAHTKNKRDRIVPINPDVVAVLRRLQAQTLRHGGPFVGMGTTLGDKWRNIVAKAGIAHITPHDLRRTYATRLIRAGVPLPTVQRLTGHETLQVLIDFYTQVTDDDARQAVAKLRRAGVAG